MGNVLRWCAGSGGLARRSVALARSKLCAPSLGRSGGLSPPGCSRSGVGGLNVPRWLWVGSDLLRSSEVCPPSNVRRRSAPPIKI